jgi:DNA polymerase
MRKREAYRNLVRQRKGCHYCFELGLVNPADYEGGNYDSNEIGPWTLWQGNLDAQIMVVGQDWGDKAYFTKWEGNDQLSCNPTNANLQKLLQQFGICIPKEPREPQEHSIFLTNVILCLKDGGLQAPIKTEWLSNCSKIFFRPLVDIVNPKVVIALGKKVSETILDLYDISHSKTWTLNRLMESAPFNLYGSTFMFPVYHCGAGGVNRNRSLEDQTMDWQRAAEWFKNSESAVACEKSP